MDWAYNSCATFERTRLLAHLVDVSADTGREPAHDFEIVMQELAAFSEDLANKPMLLVATKIDVARMRIGWSRYVHWRPSAGCRFLPFPV